MNAVLHARRRSDNWFVKRAVARRSSLDGAIVRLVESDVCCSILVVWKGRRRRAAVTTAVFVGQKTFRTAAVTNVVGR